MYSAAPSRRGFRLASALPSKATSNSELEPAKPDSSDSNTIPEIRTGPQRFWKDKDSCLPIFGFPKSLGGIIASKQMPECRVTESDSHRVWRNWMNLDSRLCICSMCANPRSLLNWVYATPAGAFQIN